MILHIKGLVDLPHSIVQQRQHLQNNQWSSGVRHPICPCTAKTDQNAHSFPGPFASTRFPHVWKECHAACIIHGHLFSLLTFCFADSM